jgi:hypothetical protein
VADLFDSHGSSGLNRHIPLDASQLGPHARHLGHIIFAHCTILFSKISRSQYFVGTIDRTNEDIVRKYDIFLSLVSSLQCRDIKFLHSHHGSERTLRLGRVGIGEHSTKNLWNYLP